MPDRGTGKPSITALVLGERAQFTGVDDPRPFSCPLPRDSPASDGTGRTSSEGSQEASAVEEGTVAKSPAWRATAVWSMTAISGISLGAIPPRFLNWRAVTSTRCSSDPTVLL